MREEILVYNWSEFRSLNFTHYFRIYILVAYNLLNQSHTSHGWLHWSQYAMVWNSILDFLRKANTDVLVWHFNRKLRRSSESVQNSKVLFDANAATLPHVFLSERRLKTLMASLKRVRVEAYNSSRWVVRVEGSTTKFFYVRVIFDQICIKVVSIWVIWDTRALGILKQLSVYILIQFENSLRA